MLVSMTVTFRRVLADMSDANTVRSTRDAELIRNLLDRLAAIRWEDYVTMQTLQEEPEEGGFLTPEEQRQDDPSEAETQIQEPGRWGPISRQATRTQLSDTEQALLQEDFPDENRRGN